MPLPQTAAPVVPQTPLVQPWPLAQACPQAPQLFGSDVSLTQALPHATSPVGQLHDPLTHDAPAAHACPQAPQLFGSDVSLTQALPQNTCPDGQVHTPATQASPAAQAFPHVPQLLGLFVVFTHAPAHTTSPVGQPPQTLATPPPPQVCPVGHVPQFSCPPHPSEIVPQFAPCAVQVVGVHAPQLPLVQGVPLAQAVPQLPQLEGSEVRAVQNPLQEVPAQLSVSPVACILYSTSRLASAPVLLAQVEPVRNDACSAAPAAKVMTMAPVSDQYWPGVSTKSWPLVPSVKRKTAAGQVDPVGVFAVATMRKTVIA